MPSSHLLNQHILLADDDDDDCALFKDALEELFVSPQLTFAINGNHLMQILQSDSRLPDIIFLDVNMPLKNGIECLREIKEIKRLKDLPVIIFSTYAQPWAIEEAHQLGANFFVRKPDTYLKLKDVIQKMLSTDWKSAPPTARGEFLIKD